MNHPVTMVLLEPGLMKDVQLGTVREVSIKLDGVGPVDNGPSTDQPHHFERKEEEKKKENSCNI